MVALFSLGSNQTDVDVGTDTRAGEIRHCLCIDSKLSSHAPAHAQASDSDGAGRVAANLKRSHGQRTANIVDLHYQRLRVESRGGPTSNVFGGELNGFGIVV